MKKGIALVLIIISIFMLVGCRNSSEPSKEKSIFEGGWSEPMARNLWSYYIFDDGKFYDKNISPLGHVSELPMYYEFENDVISIYDQATNSLIMKWELIEVDDDQLVVKMGEQIATLNKVCFFHGNWRVEDNRDLILDDGTNLTSFFNVKNIKGTDGFILSMDRLFDYEINEDENLLIITGEDSSTSYHYEYDYKYDRLTLTNDDIEVTLVNSPLWGTYTIVDDEDELKFHFDDIRFSIETSEQIDTFTFIDNGDSFTFTNQDGDTFEIEYAANSNTIFFIANGQEISMKRGVGRE